MSNTPGVVSSISLSARVRPAAHVLGVRGGGWNAIVNERGSVRLNDGSPVLDWHIAADDRWHDPSTEPSVRQIRRAGVPVVETRLRIPGGDAIQRVYAVADAGGLVVIEITNESTLPIAVAFTRPDVVSSRTPSPRGAQGIELGDGPVPPRLVLRSQPLVERPVALCREPAVFVFEGAVDGEEASGGQQL